MADYLGPDRHVVDMVEVRDPSNDFWTCGNSNPPPGILGTCILHHPDNPCPDAGGYHPSREQQQAWCQWDDNWADYTGCDCTEAYAYETIEYDLPPATISGALTGCTLQNGWCVTSPNLSLQGTEPLAGYEIISLEGTRNSDPFACPGALCDVPLLEGVNAFTYWALSSYGDSSYMGGLNAQVDTVPPVTSFVSPSEGTAVWAAGTVVLSGFSSDATSGLASAEISVDGGSSWSLLALSPDGSWSYTWDTRLESDAAHSVRARAWDQAGNLGGEAQVVVASDNTAPSVDLPDRWPIWEPIAIGAADGGSGVQRLELTIQGGALGVRKYFFVAGQSSWVWDRRFDGVLAPIGEYGVSLEAWDGLGNQGSDHGILVIPDPGVSALALPEPNGVEEEASQGMPPATQASSSTTFPPFAGPTPTASGVEALAGLGPEGPQVSTEEVAPEGGGSGVLWGAAALAAIGSAVAYVLTKRREREEEHEAELAAKKAQAAEWGAKAAALHKQVDANKSAALQKAQAAALAGPNVDEWQEEELAARHAGQDQAREAREERLAWQQRQAEEAPAHAEAAQTPAQSRWDTLREDGPSEWLISALRAPHDLGEALRYLASRSTSARRWIQQTAMDHTFSPFADDVLGLEFRALANTLGEAPPQSTGLLARAEDFIERTAHRYRVNDLNGVIPLAEDPLGRLFVRLADGLHGSHDVSVRASIAALGLQLAGDIVSRRSPEAGRGLRQLGDTIGATVDVFGAREAIVRLRGLGAVRSEAGPSFLSPATTLGRVVSLLGGIAGGLQYASSVSALVSDPSLDPRVQGPGVWTERIGAMLEGAGGAMMAGGGVLAFIPGGQPAAAILLPAGAAVWGVGTLVRSWDEISSGLAAWRGVFEMGSDVIVPYYANQVASWVNRTAVEPISDGLSAWSGIAQNATGIARALPGYVSDRVLSPVLDAFETHVAEPVQGALSSAADALRHLFGRSD